MIGSGLVDRHIAFLEALRGAGLSVSLAEDLDAIAALQVLEWTDRRTIKDAYAASLVKRHSQRPTFEALFDLYFPRLVGDGVDAWRDPVAEHSGRPVESADHAQSTPVRDNAAMLSEFRAELAQALETGDQQRLDRLAAEAVGRFGAMPGRGPGLSSWSAYTALQRVSPTELTGRIINALIAEGRTEEESRRAASRRIGAFTRSVEGDARRRTPPPSWR